MAVCLKRLHPADIDIPQINRRIACIHPFGQHHAGTTGRLDTHRIEPCRDKEVAQLGRLAKDIAIIRRKALWPIEKGLDASRCQMRETVHRARQNGLKVVKILGQGIKFKVLGNAIHAPGFGFRLERSQQNLAGIFLVIGTFIRYAQNRQIGCQPVNTLGDNVEMLAGMQRHRYAGLCPDFACPHATGIHHIISFNRTLIRHHTGHPTIRLVNIGYLDALNDRHAEIAGTLGQRLGDVDRVCLAVLWQKDTTNHIIRLQSGITTGNIGRGNFVNFHPESPCHCRCPPQFFHTFISQRHGHRPVALDAGGHAGLGFQPEIQLLRIFCQPRHILCRTQLCNQPGRMPGGAAGQLLAFQQHNIAPAKFAKMIGDRTANHPTPDNDGTCL